MWVRLQGPVGQWETQPAEQVDQEVRGSDLTRAWRASANPSDNPSANTLSSHHCFKGRDGKRWDFRWFWKENELNGDLSWGIIVVSVVSKKWQGVESGRTRPFEETSAVGRSKLQPTQQTHCARAHSYSKGLMGDQIVSDVDHGLEQGNFNKISKYDSTSRTGVSPTMNGQGATSHLTYLFWWLSKSRGSFSSPWYQSVAVFMKMADAYYESGSVSDELC